MDDEVILQGLPEAVRTGMHDETHSDKYAMSPARNCIPKKA